MAAFYSRTRPLSSGYVLYSLMLTLSIAGRCFEEFRDTEAMNGTPSDAICHLKIGLNPQPKQNNMKFQMNSGALEHATIGEVVEVTFAGEIKAEEMNIVPSETILRLGLQ